MENRNFRFNWVTCDGGPLVLIEENHLPFWEGSEPPSKGRIVEANFHWGLGVATDYDKACEVEDWLGIIDVGEGKALILGDEPNPTTWLNLNHGEGMLIRWIYANSENDVIESAKSVADNLGKDENIEFTVENTNLILLAACESINDEIYPRIKFSLPNGKYRIFTNEYKDEETWLICHGFKNIYSPIA